MEKDGQKTEPSRAQIFCSIFLKVFITIKKKKVRKGEKRGTKRLQRSDFQCPCGHRVEGAHGDVNKPGLLLIDAKVQPRRRQG